MAAYCIGSDPIEICDLTFEVKVTVTRYPFFSQCVNFLTVYFSFLMSDLNTIDMPLRYALGRFAFEFHKL